MIKILERMAGSRFEQIGVNAAALYFDFSPPVDSEFLRIRLKTANVVSTKIRAVGDYEAEIRLALPILHKQLESYLISIQNEGGGRAKLIFEDGTTFYILDEESLWDNLFSVEIETLEDGRSDYLYV